MEHEQNHRGTEDVEAGRRLRVARALGIVTQGLVLGLLLSMAIVELATSDADVRLFRYQQF